MSAKSVISLALLPFFFVFCISSPGPVPEKAGGPKDVPKLSAHQEAIRTEGVESSRVSITVGDQNGYTYKVSGYTDSNFRITVAGYYYNNDNAGDGIALLYMKAEPSIEYYDFDNYNSNTIRFSAQNGYGAWFYYEIVTPSSVPVGYIYHGLLNQTTLVASGPSSSYST